jgi:tetratricopeptide (TPR) repeat protein
LALDDHRRLGQIHGGMTYLLGSEGDFEAARRSGLRAFTIAASLGDLGSQVWTSIGLGRVYFAQGNYRAAIERMRWVTGALKDVPIDERFGRGSLMPSVACRAWLVLCLGHIGEFSEAIAWGGEGVRIAETAAGPQERVWAYYCLGRVHLERGDAHLAIPLLEQAVPLCGGGRFPIYSPRVLACLGAARTMRGDLDAALPLLEQAASEAQSINLVYGHPEALIHTGEAHVAAGRLDEARRYAAHALELAMHQGARGDEARARYLLGEITSRAAASAGEQALTEYAAARRIAEELGMAPLRARCHLGLGSAHQRLGQNEEARGDLAHAIAMLRAMQMRYWLERCEALVASAGGVGKDSGTGPRSDGG